jgi:lipopolysaccharide transport system ATP-binding protein
MLLEDGFLGFNGETLDGIHYYQNSEFKAKKRKVKWDLDEAPGNASIKVLSFSAEPIDGKILNVDSGISLKYTFLNHKEGINLGTTLEVITKEEVIVFHKGVRVSENKNSQKGIYEVAVDIPPFLLNANTYKVKVIFGESQRYKLYEHSNIYSFELENTNTGQGSNMNRVPGVIRPHLKWTVNLINEGLEG